MAYPIEEKLVIAVASSALFALDEADEVFCKLGNLCTLEDEREEQDANYRRFLKTAIVTARNAPAHRRVVNILRSWNITVDETHFLGGMDKGRILETLKPHIFFDDQQHPHLDAAQKFTPSVHIPFGVAANRKNQI